MLKGKCAPANACVRKCMCAGTVPREPTYLMAIVGLPDRTVSVDDVFLPPLLFSCRCRRDKSIYTSATSMRTLAATAKRCTNFDTNLSLVSGTL